MSEKLSMPLWNEQQGHAAFQTVWRTAKAHLSAGRRMLLTLAPETRSTAQNALMWSCLSDLACQVTWFGKKLTADGWKNFITGHLDGQDLHPNIDGTGFISIQRGRSTSSMTKAEMTAVIDLAHAFGSDKGVIWSPTSLGRELEKAA